MIGISWIIELHHISVFYDHHNNPLTHWGREMHICIRKLTTIGSDNSLSPDWRQAITWTNAKILLIWTLATNYSEILSKICTFSFKKMHLKMSSAKWQLSCLSLNVLKLNLCGINTLPAWNLGNKMHCPCSYSLCSSYKNAQHNWWSMWQWGGLVVSLAPGSWGRSWCWVFVIKLLRWRKSCGVMMF